MTVTTYEPDIVPMEWSEYSSPYACMFPVPDGTGSWMSVAEHENIVYELQQRITVLENVCDEQSQMLQR